jgi:uncharacterized 2Fe-2S/4Fe-4S cluster protein (DUF4445 family)
MYKAGILENNGRMKGGHPLVRHTDGHKEIVLAAKAPGEPGSSDITFSQKDVREIQLAKGAIRTGIDVLLKTQGLQAEQIDQVLIAGAFGTYIDIDSARDTAMLPDIPSDRFVQVGNAAGLGSRLALVSARKREEAVRIAKAVDYIELATFPDFSSLFAKSMYLGRR